MPLAAAVTTLAMAAAPTPGPAEAASDFYALFERRPAEACTTYLTPEARRQWDRRAEREGGTTCAQKRLTGAGDERGFRVAARPGPKVARVEVVLLEPGALCDGDHGEGHPVTRVTVVRRDRWRIARFSPGTGCVRAGR